MKKILSIVAIITVPLLGSAPFPEDSNQIDDPTAEDLFVDNLTVEEQPKPSFFSSEKLSIESLRSKADQLQADTAHLFKNREPVHSSGNVKLDRMGPSKTSVVLTEVIDFTKWTIACTVTAYLINNVLLENKTSKKKLLALGIAGAAAPRLPNYINLLLGFIV